uniref:Uncharacterized protein n=1 Tax=Opuntia streptacantha TaxID=393608 RepID=A0A7C9D032_OPUST
MVNLLWAERWFLSIMKGVTFVSLETLISQQGTIVSVFATSCTACPTCENSSSRFLCSLCNLFTEFLDLSHAFLSWSISLDFLIIGAVTCRGWKEWDIYDWE